MKKNRKKVPTMVVSKNRDIEEKKKKKTERVNKSGPAISKTSKCECVCVKLLPMRAFSLFSSAHKKSDPGNR